MTIIQAPDKKQIKQDEDARMLPLVMEAVAMVEAAAKHAGAYEERLASQVRWLDAHPQHAKWWDRHNHVVSAGERHEEILSSLYTAGATLHRRVDHLSAEGKKQAEIAMPGVTQGINWARRMHCRYSPHAGVFHHLIEEGRE